MKNLKKFYAVAIALVMLVSMIVPVAVTAASDYQTEAETLYALGLYKGVSTTPGEFNPDLDATLNRQTAATMVLRLFGWEDEALDMDEMEARDILDSKFKDAASVDPWALKQVAYAVEADIIKGFPDGTFAPKGLLTGQQYATLLLKMLGYSDFTFDMAGKRFGEVAGLTTSEQMKFSSSSSIPKSILVGASFAALSAMPEGSTSTLAEELVKDGIIDGDVAEEYGLIVTVEPTEEPSVEPTPVATADPDATVDPDATETPVSYDSDVVITAGTNPTMMAQTVADFNFLNFTVKNNNASDVTFSQFTIEMDRFIGVNTNVSDIKIWEGTKRKSPGTATWSGATYSAVVNLTTPIVIAAGEEKTFKVTADVASASLGEQYKFTITNMNFGGSPVVGVPFIGNAVGVSTVVSAGVVAITDETISSTSTNFAIGGRGIEVGKFKLTAPNDEKVTVNSIKVANAGSGISTGEIDNVELYNGTTLLGSAAVDQDIVFEEPLEIPASGSVTLTVKINTTVDIGGTGETDTFKPTIADVKDIDAIGDKFGSTLDLDTTWTGRNTYTAAGATVTVTGIQTAQSTTALQTAKNFKLGTIYVKNNNVEDIRLSTLKVNILPSGALEGAGSIKNLRLIAPDGTTVLDSATDLESKPGIGADAAGANDWVVTFTLANEYTIAKNTEVGFAVLADIPSASSTDTDKNKTIQLTFYQSAVPTSVSNTMAHLLAVGQSSGTQLYTATTGPVSANTVAITPSSSQTVVITQASNWDSTSGAALAVGSGRIVANWKIADPSVSGLSENAEVTKLVLRNVVTTSPASYYLSNFELYHDGVKVGTAATMASDWTVTFGDGETSMFTVTDGDSTGKTLVVKCDISSDAAKNSEIDFNVGTADIEAKGASTGVPIAGATTVALTTNKQVKQRYATFVNVNTVATSVAAGTSTELLRFTVTPMSGETVDLSDMAITLTDALGSTTTAETITIYDVTNSEAVTIVGAPTFNGTTDVIVTFADADYNAQDEAVTFSVRANTSALTANGSYQIGIKYAGDMLQITAATQDGLTGFAPMGDKITGNLVTVTQ